jgi:hypothetical protein
MLRQTFSSKNTNKIRIVSHNKPYHLDDYLSVSLLLYYSKGKEVEIINKSPNDNIEDYLKDENTIVVDIGKDYNPNKNNYDHHQDKELPCSLVLILKELLQDINPLEIEFIKIIDTIDRLGPNSYKKLPEDLLIKLKIITMSNYSEIAGEILLENINDKYMKYEEFLEKLYKRLDEKGILEEAKEKYEKEEKEYLRKKNELKILNYRDYKVAISNETITPFVGRLFSETNYDILIERNQFNKENTNIIKNTSKEITKKIDYNKLKESEKYKDKIVFIHNTGFLVVLNQEVNEVINNISEILNIVIE